MGNQNPSLTILAAAMNGVTLEEFAAYPVWEQKVGRILAENLLKSYVVTAR